ncbi:MAG: hypothetical protein AMJ68_01095 [Acidithiobacillales bacterium SG8_45]|jgi:hypothetical protein|nr:MAG: hypothetical protein AMJ68_01095 [Acidithiobacillales bacterium SG8_45]
MQQNIGPIERTLRIALGIGLLAITFLVETNMRWFGLIGLVPLLTGLLGLCPTYLALGIRALNKQN